MEQINDLSLNTFFKCINLLAKDKNIEKKEKKERRKEKREGGRKNEWEERRIFILNLDIFPRMSRRGLICHHFLLTHSITQHSDTEMSDTLI